MEEAENQNIKEETKKNSTISLQFIKHLSKKLKTGNLRSIHLNALPGRYATRLDLEKLNLIEKDLAQDFLIQLTSKSKFNFKISYSHLNLNKIEEEKRGELVLLAKKLNSLVFQNEDNFKEYGIKPFGFGYPMIIKTNQSDSKKIIKAPLIIWNLNIEKSPRNANEWTISLDEDMPIVFNQVLISHIEQDMEIKLNPLSEEVLEDDVVDMHEILEICNSVIAQIGGDKIESIRQVEKVPGREFIQNLATKNSWIFWSGVFGLYRAQKESIIADLEDLINKYDEFKFDDLDVEKYQTSSISGIETDPSQENIVTKINENRSTIIQGPPGTGKSQSITALITNALENNAKCLVVCEKKTALDVIYNNLKEITLDNQAVIIDDVNRDRKGLVKKARNKIQELNDNNTHFKELEYNNKLKRYNQEKEKLNNKNKAVLQKILGDENWINIIAKYLKSLKNTEHDILDVKLVKGEFKFEHTEYFEIIDNLKESEHLFKDCKASFKALKNIEDETIDKIEFSSSFKDQLIKEFQALYAQSISLTRYIQSSEAIWGDTFSILSNANKFKIEIFSLFSGKYKAIKTAISEVKTRYKQLILLSNGRNYVRLKEIQLIKDVDLIRVSESINKYSKLLHRIIDSENFLSAYFHWRKHYLNLESKSKKVIDISANNSIEDWCNYFNRWYFNEVLVKYSNELGPFNKDDYSIQKLITLNSELKLLLRKKIKHTLNMELQKKLNVFEAKGKKFNNLYNLKASKNFKRNSIREIVKKDEDLFTSLFPVVMVNPVVASSILPLREGMFDLVIFDEASQLRIEDTFGSFVRGKYHIVSGDVHQMPPSSYFSVDIPIKEDTEEEALDEDAIGLAEKDSLLDYAVDMGFEKSFLDYHYRSKHPYLIDFSNAAFYGGRLSPMPSRENIKPIRYIHLNGLYQNRTNIEEADAVINILKKHIHPNKEGSHPSVGIATFNIDQRNLILTSIRDQCINNIEFREKYAKLEEAGLFVKNLENIQGDERDIMILSTTFGLNMDGKFNQNFGPIGKSKGYKLLNVIITRAKERVYVCSSIPGEYINRFQEEIKLNGNSQKGIFYAYLAYCRAIENGNDQERESILNLVSAHCSDNHNKPEITFIESPFEQEVFDYLKDHISEDRILMQYPAGGYRIDFVILSNYDLKPIIALECDGKQFHESEVAYAHDMHRQKIIQDNFGFEFYRIWSTNWYEDPNNELQKLLEFISRIDEKYSDSPAESELTSIEEGIELKREDEPSTGGFESADLNRIKSQKTGNQLRIDGFETVNDDLLISKSDRNESLRVGVGSRVKLKNIKAGVELIIRLTDNQNEVNLKDPKTKVVHIKSPLGVILYNKIKGDMIKLDDLDVYYEIISIDDRNK